MGDKTYKQSIEKKLRTHLEQNGIMNEMRSEMHAKVLKAMHGESKPEPLCGGGMKQRGFLKMLNHLVVDYLDWYGYKHTMETFALETGNKSQLLPRDRLQHELGIEYGNLDLPILLQMMMKLMKQNNEPNTLIDQKTQLQCMQKRCKRAIDTPPEGVSSTAIKPAPKKDAPPEERPRKVLKSIGMTEVRKSQAKVNVRQIMMETKQATRIKRDAKQALANLKKPNNYASSSASSTGSSLRHDSETEESDAFEHMPYRHVYTEKESPETTYPHNYGEEGPCDKAQCSKAANSCQLNAPNNPVRKPMKEEKPQCSTHTQTPSQMKFKRNKILFHSSKQVPSDDDVDIPVRKPKCPQTMISRIMIRSSDEDSN